MRKPKEEKLKQGNTLHYRIIKNGFALKHVTGTTDETTADRTTKINTHQRKDHWFVQFKPNMVTDTPLIRFMVTDSFGRSNFITT